MAGPMRDTSLDTSHRTKVADPRAGTAAKAETNFEYDDNEWDIGIGDLIIDLDADIEKTDEKSNNAGAGAMASSAPAPTKGKLAIEHSATVDKGLKMKIKRTKPGTKSSEVKHEIVKSGEQQNGNSAVSGSEKHSGNGSVNSVSANAGVKRGSSGHRRDKAREKHEVNGVVRPNVQRVVFPVTVSGPGPPNAPGPPPSEPPPVPSPAPAPLPATPPTPQPPPTLPPPPTLEEPKAVPPSPSAAPGATVAAPESPPAVPPKKPKTCPSDISKEMVDVCVGTSVATITEPDCLGPCEPGTSVTLEGIVWHETEGVLVVNVTWRGKTYVGTLLDCTRHDWAPPRFCDSPTSDLDARTPKGRGKRGRQATGATNNNDLSNFTETRSSVHSKLRSNNNGGAKGRRNPSGPGSPTPFAPPKTDTTPGKRKPKAPEEEVPTKKSKPPPPTPTPTPTPTPPSSSSSTSPPPSPVLLECPEPNCSKKYKHINGLKYHQSHAHGNADDEETKESAGSMSEAEEAPSPAPAVAKKEESSPAEVPAPETPTPTPMEVPESSPQQPPSTPTPTPPEIEPPPTPSTPEKSVIKPGVLRFGTQEEALLTIPTVPAPTTRPVQTSVNIQPTSPRQPSPIPTVPAPIQLVINPQTQTPGVPQHVVQIAQSLAQQNPAINTKVPQFKVKPTSVLMPDGKKVEKPINHKKKSRKSPAGSPHPHPILDPQPLGLETGGREDVQSPAYSDISDDGAPVLEAQVDGSKSKPATGDKKVEVNPGQSPHSMQHYNMYPYYGQPPYLVPSVTTDNKPKENTNDKSLEAKPGLEKEKKDGSGVSGEFQQKILPQHYYSYPYVPGYPYNIDPSYTVPMVAEEKTGVIKEEKSPGPNENVKQNHPPVPTTLHVPNPNKIKTEPGTKEKHPNENHQILKESIEMKNQMTPAYLYSRSQQQGQSVQQDEMRRYYIYPERRKDHPGQTENPQGLKATPPPQPKQSIPVPSPKHKDKLPEEKKEEKVKQEGVKPTMETQGPPPPPTSSYAYIHPGYMQSPHYGAIPFDPASHSMYARGINPMIVPSPYPNNPYMHPQLHPPMPRYHAPEDLSRPPPGGTKALDLLQHHASYYTSHKIHELQERALKSPTPKATAASASPSAERQNVAVPGPQGTPTSTSQAQAATLSSGKTCTSERERDGKDSRSPPPQRHVHTHHHTHVGLGYPILTGQYPAPYGAAVLASQQAAAVAATVIPPFSPK